MTKLSVNVNKLATLRNSRGKNLPDVVHFAEKILGCGAHGLTVHPRPDGRHIRKGDVEALSALVQSWNRSHPGVEFNIEGYPSEDFLQLIVRIQPDQCTLVPDLSEALTSNAGWDFKKDEKLLKTVLDRLSRADASLAVRRSEDVGCGPERSPSAPEAESHRTLPRGLCRSFRNTRTFERDRALSQSGRDRPRSWYRRECRARLESAEPRLFDRTDPWIDEVSIGHALICEALEQGMENTIHGYLKITACNDVLARS